MAAGIVLMWTWGRGRQRGGGDSWGAARWQEAPPPPRPLPAHLRVGLGEQLDDAGVRRGHHAVPVDLDDAVPHAHAPALCDAAPEQTADLQGVGTEVPWWLRRLRSGPPAPTPPPNLPVLGPGSHDAVLHAEAQLLAGVWPADDGGGDRWAMDDAEGH